MVSFLLPKAYIGVTFLSTGPHLLICQIKLVVYLFMPFFSDNKNQMFQSDHPVMTHSRALRACVLDGGLKRRTPCRYCRKCLCFHLHGVHQQVLNVNRKRNTRYTTLCHAPYGNMQWTSDQGRTVISFYHLADCRIAGQCTSLGRSWTGVLCWRNWGSSRESLAGRTDPKTSFIIAGDHGILRLRTENKSGWGTVYDLVA